MEGSVLLFTDVGKLRSFLDMPGHDYFKDCLVHIQAVSEDKPALWAVLLGALAYVNDWVNIRGSPNCKLVIRPELGPNKGYISLVCETKTQNGIGPGRELVISYGNEYNHNAPSSDGNAPRRPWQSSRFSKNGNASHLHEAIGIQLCPHMCATFLRSK